MRVVYVNGMLKSRCTVNPNTIQASHNTDRGPLEVEGIREWSGGVQCGPRVHLGVSGRRTMGRSRFSVASVSDHDLSWPTRRFASCDPARAGPAMGTDQERSRSTHRAERWSTKRLDRLCCGPVVRHNDIPGRRVQVQCLGCPGGSCDRHSGRSPVIVDRFHVVLDSSTNTAPDRRIDQRSLTPGRPLSRRPDVEPVLNPDQGVLDLCRSSWPTSLGATTTHPTRYPRAWSIPTYEARVHDYAAGIPSTTDPAGRQPEQGTWNV